ncbi:DUF6415 family natural product biosynthesis protein [Streptomyces stramineus]|uniref:Uncharacterized protein n=1 Tax=Streptomyces stramineus TaxID=173861 RepID=A0ABP3JXL0_9ACTN
MNATDQTPPRIESLMTGDTPPVDLVTIRATVTRALLERPVLPRAEEVRALTVDLRAHLAVMADETEARRDACARSTGDWHQWNALLNRARTDMQSDAGPGLKSAVMHMYELGRTCSHLVDKLAE